jgi:hypothetical protein
MSEFATVLPRTRRRTQSAAIIEKCDEDRKYLRDIFGLHNNRLSGLLYMAAFALALLASKWCRQESSCIVEHDQSGAGVTMLRFSKVYDVGYCKVFMFFIMFIALLIFVDDFVGDFVVAPERMRWRCLGC